MTNHHETDPVVSTNPSPVSNLEPSFNQLRSHNSDTNLHGIDNPAFEPRNRKISSEHVEVGPVRKKSILHNIHANDNRHSNNSVSGLVNGDPRIKKHSTTESLYSKTKFSDIADEDDRSWWYTFCFKCRTKDTNPSWEPPMWSKVCPYPFCPTYRQFSRIITVTLVGAVCWCLLFAIVGNSAAPPDGQLFQIALLAIFAHFGGWLINLTTLPALVGMLVVGIVMQNLNIVNIDESFSEISKELRTTALVILLIRAGLDLDPEALKKLKFIVVRLGLGPWILEFVVVMIMSRFLLGLPWVYSSLAASIVAAVSPAVVVPCLFRLRIKGYGVAKGIPTLIIAIAGIDDAASVAIFGIIKSILFSNSSVVSLVLQGPASIVGGIGFGVVWGVLSRYCPEKHDPFIVPLRVIFLLAGGMLSVFGSELIGYGGAGPLACVAVAFVSILCWTKDGWDIEENPAATAFQIFWMIFEPILFGLTGAQIKLNELDIEIATIALGILITAAILRILVTILLGIGCKLNLKEKVFVGISCMSKATVQAALGPVTLGMVDLGTPEYNYGYKILILCVLSIILTAPLSAILITILGPRLLTKTKFPAITEEWRRSHRPSIRDISIVEQDEIDDVEDIEATSSHTSINK